MSPELLPPEIVINGRFMMQPVTGVQRVARELTRALDQLVRCEARTVRLRLVCEPGADVSDLDLRVTTVERAGGASGHAWEQLVLPARVRGGHLLCLGNTAPLRSLFGTAPVTVMIHDLSYRLHPKAYRLHYRLGHRLMLPFLLRRAHALLTVSESEKAMLAALRPSALARIRVAANGGWRECRSEATAAVPGPHPGPVLYVGSLSQRKNIHGVIAAATQLAREDGRETLIVGATSDILAPIAAGVPADVAEKVRFLGPVSDLAALEGLYRRAGCLLFPSFYEASPLPPMEAMRFGVPVVVSAIPAMTERCGSAATYCDPDSVTDIVRATRAALAGGERIAGQVARGLRRAARQTWEGQAHAVLDALLGPTAARARPADEDLGAMDARALALAR